MDPQRLLQRMCARHGLQYTEAARLVPLVTRALKSPDQVRDRILHLVETNLARRAEGETKPNQAGVSVDLDHEILISVSRVLHKWSPSEKVIEMGGILPNLFPEGLDLPDAE